VGVVAVEAVLLDGRMLPEEGCLHFPMTFVALVIDAVGSDELVRLAAVRVVAAGAGHLPHTSCATGVSDWVTGAFQKKCPLLWVTLEARGGLRAGLEQAFVVLVNAVAGDAGDLHGLMGAALPIPLSQTAVVTGKARGVGLRSL
jgi:hypothetical protein